MADQPGRIQQSVQVTKDVFALVRETMVVVVLVVFLAAPEHVNSLLVKAGFTEGSIGGFKWEKLRDQAEKANADAATAGKTIAQVEEELKATRSQLDELSRKVQDPAVKTDIQDLSAQIRMSEQKTAVADDTLKSSVRAHAYVLQQIQRVEPSPADKKMRMRLERPSRSAVSTELF
jgi:septal ring factor EnvC (AmiA/AmiB activator)